MSKRITYFFEIAVLVYSYAASAQLYPSNFLWNGCSFVQNGFRSSDTINCSTTTYKLVFEDNFDSTSLNNKNWQTYYPWSRSLYSTTSGTGWERQFYKDENVLLKNGSLLLHTVIDPGLRSPDVNTDNVFFKYTSGMIYSKLDFTYGKFEIRCKIPQINGLFPAFWLYGFCAQEIDIFEFTNANATSDPSVDAGHLITTYHKAYDCDVDKGQCDYGFTRNYNLDLSADFHTYAMEWNENKMVWFLDGKIVREVYRLWQTFPNTQAVSLISYALPVKSCNDLKPSTVYTFFNPFPSGEHRMHIIANTAVLKDRAGNDGALPQDFIIDYIRAYEEVETVQKTSVNIDFNIFPNPFTNVFSMPIKMNGHEIGKVSVYNLMGQNISFKSEINGDLLNVELQGQEKGIYILTFECEGEITTRKILCY